MNDRLPPQAIDLEKAVLGAILVDSQGYNIASTILKPEHFYQKEHTDIFEAMTRIYLKGSDIDLLTVRKEMPELDHNYLVDLTSNIASSAHIESHATVIFEKYVTRQVVMMSIKTAKEAYEADVWDLINGLENALQDIRGSVSVSECKSISSSILEHLSKPKGFFGVTTGFKVINNPTNGWKESNLYIIAARPGMGKTAWLLQSALKAAQEDNPVLIYSIEMGEEQIINRLVSLLSTVEHEKIIKQRLTESENILVQEAYQNLADLPIYIDYSSVQHAKDFVHKTRSIKRKRGIKAVYVDYLQKMRSHEQNKVIEIGTIASTLKITAKDLNIPVVALSQLSREVEKSTSKRPELSHLRESGRIEEEADFAAFLYRKFYYHQQGLIGFDTITIEDAEFESRNYGEFIIAKNRHGALGTVYLNFKCEQMAWGDYVQKRHEHIL